MESELETLQGDRTKLKDEMETQRRTCSGMEQQIETFQAEVSTLSKTCELKHQNAFQFLLVQKLTTQEHIIEHGLYFKVTNQSGRHNYSKLFLQTTQLRSELVSCSEERDDLNQSLGQWREKAHSLEKTNSDTRNLIAILEDDIRAGRKECETLQNNMEKLKTEKQQVCGIIKSLGPVHSSLCQLKYLRQVKKCFYSELAYIDSIRKCAQVGLLLLLLFFVFSLEHSNTDG